MTDFTVNSGNYSILDGGIKIPADGVYEIEAELSGSFDANKGWIVLTKNSASGFIATGLNRNTAATSYNTTHISKIAVSLSANDVIYLYAMDSVANLNGGLDGKVGTYVTIRKVS